MTKLKIKIKTTTETHHVDGYNQTIEPAIDQILPPKNLISSSMINLSEKHHAASTSTVRFQVRFIALTF